VWSVEEEEKKKKRKTMSKKNAFFFHFFLLGGGQKEKKVIVGFLSFWNFSKSGGHTHSSGFVVVVAIHKLSVRPAKLYIYSNYLHCIHLLQ
jgi:hypothetical protein